MDTNVDAATFEKAAEFVEDNAADLSTDVLIKLYGFYKQATVGNCNVPQPSMFNFVSRTKWNSWNQLKNISKEEAMQKYVECVNQTCGNWKESKDNIEGKSNNAWMSVSCFVNDEKPIADNEKTIFDWVKEGNLEEVKKQVNYDVNFQDGEGLTLMHWTADRGHLEVMQHLVSKGANLNSLDKEGQTPLHYAVSCGYPLIVTYLISAGADSEIADKNNKKPVDLAETEEVSSLFNK